MLAADREWAGAVGYDSAEQEGATDAYVCRLLPLTCLAPDIVAAMLDGRQPKELRLAEVLGMGRSRGRTREAFGVSAQPLNNVHDEQSEPPEHLPSVASDA
jgi:hypothetical protein